MPWRLSLFLCFILICSCQSSPGDSTNNEELESFTRDTMLIQTDTLVDDPGVTYEDPDRTTWQNPSLVIDKLGNLKGKTVADIGAGTGYFSFRLAREGARVIAIDIEQEYLDYIDKRQEESIVASGNYPLVNTYTYLNDPVDYLTKVKKGMAETGMITIVDYKDAKNPVVNNATILVAPERVADELKQAGFSNVVIDRNSLQYQYIITAKK